jgi:RES domain-containing protein
MADPTPEQLQTRLARLVASAVPFEGVVYRSSTPKYATEADLLTGEGSRRFGGRWNPVGIAMVYASLTPETAMAETLAHNRYYGVPIEDAMPRTFVAIEVTLRIVLDLRSGDLRRRLRVSEDAVIAVDWRAEVKAGREPITQRLGRAAHTGPWEGLIVPSAADPDGHNLLILPDKLDPDSGMKVVNADKLG